MMGSGKRIGLGAGALFAYLFLLAPLVVVIGASFDDGASAYFRFPPEHLSLRWYRALPAKYWHGLGLSCMIAFAAAPTSPNSLGRPGLVEKSSMVLLSSTPVLGGM